MVNKLHLIYNDKDSVKLLNGLLKYKRSTSFERYPVIHIVHYSNRHDILKKKSNIRKLLKKKENYPYLDIDGQILDQYDTYNWYVNLTMDMNETVQVPKEGGMDSLEEQNYAIEDDDFDFSKITKKDDDDSRNNPHAEKVDPEKIQSRMDEMSNFINGTNNTETKSPQMKGEFDVEDTDDIYDGLEDGIVDDNDFWNKIRDS